ncbi:peptidoglycan-binding protein [uncultured Jatrophihabitans sp.]|uniref:peptidoglycan-binding protein n=1 Tax=uncultured Jatrophihabitans sp. TaxID=1610747 RepID=UPI0035CC453B
MGWKRTSTPACTDVDENALFFAGWRQKNAVAVPDDGPDHVPSRARPRLVAVGALLVTAGTSVVLTTSSASADPTPNTWYRLRICESGNNYKINTGNDHYGAYQFDLSTWRSVGGSGYPQNASKAEQDARALILYRKRGWQPWQCASILGLREDSDARSGRMSDITISTGGSTGSTTPPTTTTGGIPAFPGGTHWYTYGEMSSNIKILQDQLHKRGYLPVGTGAYDASTLAVVKQLQRLNGLIPNGYIGPNTWRLAWTGTYSTSATVQAPSVPAFPGGTHWYTYGETSSKIKIFQDQMHKRGYFPVGTGQYGPNTLRMVKQLQRLNGLVPNGYLGPNTWRLAWTGSYHA